MFNAFARDMILVLKKHCDTRLKAAIKRKFRLFDAHSSDYVSGFLERNASPACLAIAEDPTTEVLPGVTVGDVMHAVPANEKSLCSALITGMVLSAALVQDGASEDIVSLVASAVSQKDVAVAQGAILDDDLLDMIRCVAEADIPDAAMNVIADICDRAKPVAGADMSIIELAKEVSQSVDLGSLSAAGGASGFDMSKLMQAIDGKVKQRMSDGSMDPEKLCNEAQAILGMMGPRSA
jgi:hypothetical protein